uniref:Protein SGT1 homolog n=1 Tax=Triticum aestivum TaxID=4565 RepID=A0A0D3MT28_WHEAT|nr:SGT1 [Triticum aestivum]AIX87839.1 SGT1 [Triticum aestivum]
MAAAAAASDLESKAKEAFVDDDFELAAELYTQAIEAGPATAELYADRAQAHIKLGSYTEAVADANKAIELDPSMHKAYLRKGSACIKLEEYQTAKAALEVGSSYASGDSRFTRLMKECDDRIAEEASQVPVKNAAAAVASATSSGASSGATTVATEAEDQDGANMENAQPTMEVPSKPKYRHDYYNTPTEVVLTIFAKGVPADSVVVDFGEQMLSVSIELPGEEPYHFQPRLFSKIVPDKCKYTVLSTKVEMRLAKAEPVTWTSLDYTGKPKAPQKINVPAESAQRPSYPSSKSKKDWDKLEAEVKKQEKDEKLDGDAALNKFFREIYSDADEDMRRAMMKSFVESNGTVLSTNWKDVGKKTVEGSPPDGMELKKWEY